MGGGDDPSKSATAHVYIQYTIYIYYSCIHWTIYGLEKRVARERECFVRERKVYKEVRDKKDSFRSPCELQSCRLIREKVVMRAKQTVLEMFFPPKSRRGWAQKEEYLRDICDLVFSVEKKGIGQRGVVGKYFFLNYYSKGWKIFIFGGEGKWRLFSSAPLLDNRYAHPLKGAPSLITPTRPTLWACWALIAKRSLFLHGRGAILKGWRAKERDNRILQSLPMDNKNKFLLGLFY